MSATVAEGQHSSAKPAPSSTTAVTVYKAFTDKELLKRRQQRIFPTFSSLAPVQVSFLSVATLPWRFGFDRQVAGARQLRTPRVPQSDPTGLGCYSLPT